MEILIGLFVIYIIYRIIKSVSAPKNDMPEITVRYEISSSSDYEKPRGKPARWYAKGEAVSVKGFDITGGLIYVGDVLLDMSGYENDACLINPKLKVKSLEPWEGGDEMGYWPGYGRIPEKCRGAYLKWLADGRKEPEAYIGYVFLFFYGLERRLFVDGKNGKISEEERSEIVSEVCRLLEIYGGNRSFRGYASNFLAMEWVLYQIDKPVPKYIDFNDRYCSEPFQVVLAKHVANENPIPVDVALQWINLHPEFGLRTPARRCVKEFQELFIGRYKDKFGDGIKVKPNKTRLKLDYRAASPSIRGGLRLEIPDLPNPFILTGPVKKIAALAEECTLELESYSRYLGRKDNNPESLAALALLPKELIARSGKVGSLKQVFSAVCNGGPGLIGVDEIHTLLKEQAPLKMGKKDSEIFAKFIEGVGYGLAPDVRYQHINVNPESKVVIFEKGHGVDFRPSKEYRLIATILRLGAMVSQIDDDISPHEEEMLQRLVLDNRELTGIEKDSLLAFTHWCLRTPQSTAGVKQRLAEVSKNEKTAISHILISVAHADGRIEPSEVKQLERLYTTLGLDKGQVAGDLHTLVATSEPVTVSQKDPDSSYSIPVPTSNNVDKGFILNEELIRIREEETRQVKGVLENIFADEVEEEFGMPLAQEAVIKSPLDSLDDVHQTLLHSLTVQETWERNVLHEKCKELGLMVDGALEVLNEWAFEHANAPLIEDGEPIYIDVSLVKEITGA